MDQKSNCGIGKIRNLNDICRGNNKGLYKQWMYESNNHMKMCNYMQKINYCLQDLNSEIEFLVDPKYKDVVFIISLVDWIREAFDKIHNSIRKDVIAGFEFSKEDDLKIAKKYLRAIRSFVVGHPLGTTEHEKFGFDGNFICVDIRSKNNTLDFFTHKHYYILDYNGLSDGKREETDYYLYCYSDKDDGMKYFRFISCQFKDIYDVARIYIEKLYELDKYLSKKKKREFGEKNESN